MFLFFVKDQHFGHKKTGPNQSLKEYVKFA